MKTRLFIILVCILVICSGCALQDDIIILEERLIVLERQNQVLQQKNDGLQQQLQRELELMGRTSEQSERDIRSRYAGLNVNLDVLQRDIQMLTGRIEELEHQVNRQAGDVGPLSKKVDELSLSMAKSEQRVIQLEQYLNLDGQTKTTPATALGETEKSPAINSEQKIYDDAKIAFDNGELDKARQGFTQLINKFPDSDNADNAQFWIGESYYREKWYEKAILEYQTVLEKYPKGNKVPGAMLKQGMAFINLGDKSNARLVLRELQKNFPQSNEASIATQKLSEL